MTLYADWVARQRAKSKSRAHWVCGSVDVLRESVLEDVKAKSGAAPDDREFLDARDGAGAVWDAVRSEGFRDRPRLVVIRYAERLVRDLEPLGEWISGSRRRPKSWLCFVAVEDDWPVDRFSEIREAAQVMVVRCSSVATNRLEEVAADWLRDLPLAEGVPTAVVVRSGGDLFIMRQICRRLEILPGAKGISAVDVERAWPETPGAAFLRYLISGQKGRAATAAPRVEDPVSVLRLLEWTLDVLARIHRGRLKGAPTTELRNREGLPYGTVERYAKIAVRYDLAKVQKDTSLIAQAYRHLEAGRPGVLETVALLW